MVKILDYKTFENNRLVYTDPTKVKGGSYIANIKYKNDNNELQDIIIQTPKLLCESGIIKTDTRSYLELNFDKEHWLFYEFITDLDDHNIVIVEKNSESWFKQKFPLDIVEEFYKSPVKVGRGKNPPKIKIRLPLCRGKVECGIYDNKRQSIHYSEINKSSKMICVLKLVGLRFLKQQVICEWTPIQLSACDLESNVQSNYLIDESLLSDAEEAEAIEAEAIEAEVSAEDTEAAEPPNYSEENENELIVENLDEDFLNEDNIEKIHKEKLEIYEKNNKIAELSEKISFLELEISKKDVLIDKFKSLLN